jgi:hypothetical protein
MAIYDKTLEICEELAISSLTNGGIVGQVIDLGPQENYVQPFIVIKMGKTSAAGGTSLGFSLQTSDSDSLSSAVALFTVAPVLTAKLKGDVEIAVFRVPFGAKRYIGVTSAVSGTFTAGTIDIRFAHDVSKWI